MYRRNEATIFSSFSHSKMENLGVNLSIFEHTKSSQDSRINLFCRYLKYEEKFLITAFKFNFILSLPFVSSWRDGGKNCFLARQLSLKLWTFSEPVQRRLFPCCPMNYPLKNLISVYVAF